MSEDGQESLREQQFVSRILWSIVTKNEPQLRHQLKHVENIANFQEFLDECLVITARLGMADMASILVRDGADVNCRVSGIFGSIRGTEPGLTPLHAALLACNAPLASMLIQHGADELAPLHRCSDPDVARVFNRIDDDPTLVPTLSATSLTPEQYLELRRERVSFSWRYRPGARPHWRDFHPLYSTAPFIVSLAAAPPLTASPAAPVTTWQCVTAFPTALWQLTAACAPFSPSALLAALRAAVSDRAEHRAHVRTVLHWAARGGDARFVADLLRGRDGAELLRGLHTDGAGRTPLHTAVATAADGTERRDDDADAARRAAVTAAVLCSALYEPAVGGGGGGGGDRRRALTAALLGSLAASHSSDSEDDSDSNGASVSKPAGGSNGGTEDGVIGGGDADASAEDDAAAETFFYS
jgi:ankyrin repeat protein